MFGLLWKSNDSVATKIEFEGTIRSAIYTLKQSIMEERIQFPWNI